MLELVVGGAASYADCSERPLWRSEYWMQSLGRARLLPSREGLY
jgi:hypothetical protein